MYIPDEEERLIRDVIKSEVRECRGDLNRVTRIVKRELENHRSGVTAAEDILSKDWEDIVCNVEEISSINFVSFETLVLLSNLLLLIFTGVYDLVVVLRRCFSKPNFDISISHVDRAFIDDTYIDCCQEFWFEEIDRFLKDNYEENNREGLENLLDSVLAIEDLSHVPEAQRELEYYKLIANNRSLIGKSREKKLVKKFKSVCLDFVLRKSRGFQAESHFLEVFVNLMRGSSKISDIIDDLELRRFCSGDLTVVELLKNVEKSNLEDLKEAAKVLEREDTPFLSKTSRSVIEAYVKPVEISKITLDGRSVIEATGKIVVVSEILKELEDQREADEVRIVGGDIVHVDADLVNDVWHGRNVVVLSKTVKIHGERTWNLSGRNSDHDFSRNAGTGPDGNGEPGSDGHAGESGGNVLIEADDVLDPENLRIVSNGGKGSKGQDGGDGEDGRNGEGIRASQLDEKFPSPVKLFDLRSKLVENIDQSIQECTEVTNRRWSDSPNMFVQVQTSQGNEITFSYAGRGWITNRQALLLYQGSSGRPAKPGGECGRGGEGGSGGEIVYRNVTTYGNPGADGDPGIGGLHGQPGKNGWDIGYTDYSTWSSPEFSGRDENSRVQIKYHDSSWGNAPGSSVWCPYRGEYAELTSRPLEYKKGRQYQQRADTKSERKLQDQAVAVKKKSISRGQILSRYSQCFKSFDINVSSNMDNVIERAVQAMIDNSQQEEEVSTDLRVRHVVGAAERLGKNFRRRNNVADTSSGSTNQPDIERMIGELTSTAASDSCFKNSELSVSELTRIFERLKGSAVAENWQWHQLFTEKYRSAVLREISKHSWLLDPDADNGSKVSAERASRYLITTDSNTGEISHNVLGTLDQYLDTNRLEHREKVRKFVEDNISQIEDNEALRRSVMSFVFRTSATSRYYKEYEEFLKKQLHDLNILLEPLVSELEPHPEIYDLWRKRNEDEAIRFKLNREIVKHKSLNVRYRCFNKQLEQTYDWSRCCEDQDFLRAYCEDIRENGPSSESYRELVAHLFEVNIRFYSQDKSNGYRLIGDHNASADRVVNILGRDRNCKLTQLAIDEGFFKLEKERAKIGEIYSKILTRMARFEGKREIDDYFETGTFLLIHDDLDNDYQLSDYDLSEDQAVIEIMKHFSSPEERLQITKRLMNISSRYVGRHDILHHIFKRFSNDGKHISYQELCSLVNSIMSSLAEDKNNLDIIGWIVAACPQKNWTDELVLLEIEDHLKKTISDKPKWRDYLSKVTDKNILALFKSKLNLAKPNGSIDAKIIEDILSLLSSIPNEMVNLDGMELSDWPCAMKECYWTYKLSPLSNGRNDEILSGASYYLLSMENIFGTHVVSKFIETLIGKAPPLEKVLDTLTNFCNGNWNLSEREVESLSANPSVDAWIKEMDDTSVDRLDRDVSRLVELIKGNGNSSGNILDRLPDIENTIRTARSEIPGSMKRLVEWVKDNNDYPASTFNGVSGTEDLVRIICKYELKTGGSSDPQTLYYRVILRKYSKNYLAGISDSERKTFLDETRDDILLSVVDEVIKSKKGFKLRDTQKLAILTLLTNERNTLLQVSTGEGKTLIVVASAIVKALMGEKVHVITSSSVLAIRDAEENLDVYGAFGITVGHNCSKNIDERKAAYSSSDVVYGDLSSFQRDYLLDTFYGRNMMGDCKLENASVFVDEVDSMLLDKGNNMLYLSHDIAGLDKLESIYLYIWQWVSIPAANPNDYSHIFDVEAIRESVMDDMHGLLKKEHLRKIDPQMDEQGVNQIWKGLVDSGIVDEGGKLLKEKISRQDLITIPSPNSSRLFFMLKEHIKKARCIRVPNHLKPFVELHLDIWIKSAITAAAMHPGHDYRIDVDTTGTARDRDPRIIIVDRDTGTDQPNSEWEEALHQFLQLKHGCKLSMQSLKAVFVSNVSYLKKYRTLYGLTGTLGSKRERDLLNETHGADFVTIPTSKSKRFVEKPPIICSDKRKWTDEIYKEATRVAKRGKRSVLIICETIQAAESLNSEFSKRDAAAGKNVHLYTRDHEEFAIAQGKNELGQGDIIISTNLCGRGTDLKITSGLKKAGGLHVILTYLPDNRRILEQAFGRAGRKGDEGSGRLIIVSSSGRDIFDLRKDCDLAESQRVSSLKEYYENHIITEEKCFESFQKAFKNLNKTLAASGEDDEVNKMLLRTCLDKWTFWLDENNKSIKNTEAEDSRQRLEASLDEFVSQFRNFNIDGVQGQPIRMVDIGKLYCQKGKFDKAIELFDRVIELEPTFCEAAHYYKVFAMIRNSDESSRKQAFRNAKTELREAARLFDEHSRFSISAGVTVSAFKQYSEKRNIIQINTYAEQHKNLSHLYCLFSQSIDDFYGKPVTPESFFNSSISENLSEGLYRELLGNGILRKPKIKMNVTENTWEKVDLGYGVSVDKLKDLISSIEGREIDDETILTMLKENLKIPSREDFWNLLIKHRIFFDQVEHVVINVGKLKELDSWLLVEIRERIANNELRRSDANEIVLYSEESVTEPDRIIVEKIALQNLMTATKRGYEYLEKKGVFSENRRVLVDSGEISSTPLARYDSITLNDFATSKIPEDDARLIFAELVRRNVLRKDISSGDIYRLGIPSDQIDLIKLPSYPVYQNAVKELLSFYFTYRICLDKIINHLKRGDSPVNPGLASHPHNTIIHRLLDQRIIKPVEFGERSDDLGSELRKIFDRKLSERDLEVLMLEYGLSLNSTEASELCRHLVAKKWLCVEKTGNDVVDRCLGEILGTKYKINVPTKREPLTLFTMLENRIGKIFEDRLKLAERSSIEHVIQVFEEATSPLKTLDIPDVGLKDLIKYNGFNGSTHLEEVATFTLNSLDKVIILEEKKWSWKTTRNTAICVAMGIAQIAVGATVEVISGGLLTNAAAGLIGEGIGDIIFAIGSYRSGHFSWKAYGKHKLQSMTLTVATAGLGPLLLNGAALGRTALTMGSEMIAEVGAKTVAMAVGKIVLSKVANAAAIGLSYTRIDALVQNFARTISNRLSTTLVSNIRSKISESGIGASLENIYRALGRDGAMRVVREITESSLNEKSLIARYLPTVSASMKTVCQMVNDQIGKVTRAGKNVYNVLAKVFSSILAAIPWAEKVAHLVDIRNVTGNLLNGLQTRLRNAVQTHGGQTARLETPEEIADCQRFKTEVIEGWNSLVCDKAEKMMERHVVRPLLDQGIGKIVERCERIIENEYRSWNTARTDEGLEERRREYCENHKNCSTVDANGVAECQVVEYHNSLEKLAAKKSDSEVLSAVRENVPMDASCIEACTKAVRKVSGIEELTIVAKGESRTSSSTQVVELELIDNRFKLYRIEGNAEFDNNCLYETVSRHTTLNVSRESFAFEVASFIQRDKSRCHVGQSYDSLPSERVIRMSAGRNVVFDGRVNSSVLNAGAEVGQSLQRPVRDFWIDRNADWGGETFSEVETRDGFLFLHSGRRVAAAIGRSPGQSLRVVACEEVGESRYEYNSWRRRSIREVNGPSSGTDVPGDYNARRMVTEQRTQRTNFNWRLRSQRRSFQIHDTFNSV